MFHENHYRQEQVPGGATLGDESKQLARGMARDNMHL